MWIRTKSCCFFIFICDLQDLQLLWFIQYSHLSLIFWALIFSFSKGVTTENQPVSRSALWKKKKIPFIFQFGTLPIIKFLNKWWWTKGNYYWFLFYCTNAHNCGVTGGREIFWECIYCTLVYVVLIFGKKFSCKKRVT